MTEDKWDWPTKWAEVQQALAQVADRMDEHAYDELACLVNDGPGDLEQVKQDHGLRCMTDPCSACLEGRDTEVAEVAYRETQYGVRLPAGSIEPVAIGPAEAQRYRDAGVDLHERSRVAFVASVSDWRESTPPETAANP